MDYELTQAIDFGREPRDFELEIAKEYPPLFLVGDVVSDSLSMDPWEVKCILWSDYFHTWVYSDGKNNVFVGQNDIRPK